MRRSSSGALVSEGDGASASAAGHHHHDTALPTYDPQYIPTYEVARARALERAVHCIPLLLLLCALVLWLSAAATSPLVHLGEHLQNYGMV